MAVQPTNIVWTDYSANHWKGCAKVSEGCMNCWAAGMADRFGRTPEPWTVDNIDQNLTVYDEDTLEALAHLDPGWCFYPSSSDPYLPWLGRDAERAYMQSVTANDHLCFQVLTKWGPERQRAEQDAMPAEYEPEPDTRVWPDNVMLGVSVESPLRTYRLDWLRAQEAAMKFVSFEPLVGPIDDPDLSGIDWAIVGGESLRDGDRRREMDSKWAVSLYESCRRQSVPFLFKQHSGPYPEQNRKLDVGNGPEEFNEFPETAAGLPDTPREFLPKPRA